MWVLLDPLQSLNPGKLANHVDCKNMATSGPLCADTHQLVPDAASTPTITCNDDAEKPQWEVKDGTCEPKCILDEEDAKTFSDEFKDACHESRITFICW